MNDGVTETDDAFSQLVSLISARWISAYIFENVIVTITNDPGFPVCSLC